MGISRNILLADPDVNGTRRLAAALRARGHRVLSVRDGSKALEVAVMRVPDVVLYDTACPLLDARTFAEIVRTNPRTAGIPVVVVGVEETQERSRPGIAYLQKPFNIDEVLARIEQILRRSQAAAGVRREGALKGSLSEVGLPDLLQMLSMNRRSGVLGVEGQGRGFIPSGTGEVMLRAGRIVDARLEELSGAKAAYRMLGWSRGSFTFTPGDPPGAERINAGTDEILLEGLRQLDEIRVLEGKAPARDAVITLAVDLTSLPDGLHPVTEEVLGLVDLYRTCGEILDASRASDLELLRALTTLVERGMVRVVGRTPGEGGGRRLVEQDVAFALHGRYAGRQPGRRLITLRAAVVAGDPRALRTLLTDLAEVDGFRASTSPHLLELGFGELGVLSLTSTLNLVLTALPFQDVLAPLWQPFGAGAVGVVVLPRGGEQAALEALIRLYVDRGRPVALVGDDGTLAAVAGGLGLPAPTSVDGLARLLERSARLR